MTDKEYFRNYRARQRANETAEQKESRLARQRNRRQTAMSIETAEEAAIRKKKRNHQQQIRRKRKRAEALKDEFEAMDGNFGDQSKQVQCSSWQVPLVKVTCWPCGHSHVCCSACASDSLSKRSRCPGCKKTLLLIHLPDGQLMIKRPQEHDQAGTWSCVSVSNTSRRRRRKRRRLF